MGKREHNKTEDGMISVETAICLTMFVSFLVIFLNIINLVYVQVRVQSVIRNAALEYSTCYAIEEFGNNYDSRFVYNEKVCHMLGILSTRNDYIGLGDVNSFPYCTIMRIRFDKAMEDISIMGNTVELQSWQVDKDSSGNIDVQAKYCIKVMNLPFLNGAGINIPMTQHAVTRVWD